MGPTAAEIDAAKTPDGGWTRQPRCPRFFSK
jgi:hypothetical protein